MFFNDEGIRILLVGILFNAEVVTEVMNGVKAVVCAEVEHVTRSNGAVAARNDDVVARAEGNFLVRADRSVAAESNSFAFACAEDRSFAVVGKRQVGDVLIICGIVVTAEVDYAEIFGNAGTKAEIAFTFSNVDVGKFVVRRNFAIARIASVFVVGTNRHVFLAVDEHLSFTVSLTNGVVGFVDKNRAGGIGNLEAVIIEFGVIAFAREEFG